MRLTRPSRAITVPGLGGGMPPLADILRWSAHYCQVFAGTAGRLVLQAVYFLVLANTLTLAEFGVFASACATGIIIGAFSGFGFASLAFRVAVHRQRLLGAYLGIYLAASLVTLPIGLLVAMPIYLGLFKGSLSLSAFLMIMVVELFAWRLIEGLNKINNGLGRFVHAALLSILTTGARAATAVGFVLLGDGTLESWVLVYFAANSVIAVAALALFCPRVRLRFNFALFTGRVREALLPACSALAFDTQTEIDKLVLLAVAGQRAAGIYAISVRILELVSVPIRSFYVLYSRKLIRERRTDRVIARNLAVEAGIFAVAVAGYGAFLIALNFKPGLLGANVEVARQLFGVALLVPAFRALMEFHSELYFAYRKLGTELVAATILVSLKAVALAAVVSSSPDPAVWGLWLNAIFAALYVASACTVYRAVSSVKPRGALPEPAR